MAQSGVEARPGPETTVQIRVAIQEAEDVDELEDEEEGAETRGAGDPARYLSPGWGSASEEEPSRGHRRWWAPRGRRAAREYGSLTARGNSAGRGG
ncbi:La- protein 6 [Saguinus oedipus]|uniref:La- protein 6 n=1 Tax=Saguinus oedipus TaxID=9490 RepID=A0ABQ9V1V1_SAGOE|nr:La- protein 6 [Saguinus oedipus]